MAEKNKFEFLDYLVLVVKWKKFLIVFGLLFLILSYLTIYFFVEEKWEATAVIVASDNQGIGSLSGFLSGLDNLPFGLGGGAQSAEMDRFFTFVYSRSSLEDVIDEFDLMEDYNPESLEKTLKYLRADITTEISEDNAFVITVRASSPQKAAEMANYIVQLINNRLIELNVSKAADNRIFLENRYEEVQQRLQLAEDSLRMFQEKTGIFEAEGQIKATIEAYSKLESELAAKKVELAVYKEILGSDAPKVEGADVSVEKYQEMLDKLKSSSDGNQLLIGLDKLPERALQYFRHYRDVKVYMSILEFLVPLYEQAKFEEKKSIPILKVIDYAAPPEKRAYPKRVYTSLAITFAFLLLVLTFLFIREAIRRSENPKVIFIRKELFNFSSKSRLS